MLTKLGEVLDEHNGGPSASRLRLADTTDTIGEDTDTSYLRRSVQSKRTYKMKKSNATDELAACFVTGPTDASTKLSELNIEACRAQFQPFVQDQRLLECQACRNHSDISNVLSHLTHQSGFRSRRLLYRVSSVCLKVVFLPVIRENCCEFHVFELTTLFQPGPLEKVPPFALNRDRVKISCRAVQSAICCIQSYVRLPLFTQRDFFRDNRTPMLLNAVNVAGSVSEDSVYDAWNRVLPKVYDAVDRGLRMAYSVLVVLRKDAPVTSERWFDLRSVESSVVGESSGQQSVRMSNVVEVGEVECLLKRCSICSIDPQHELQCKESCKREA